MLGVLVQQSLKGYQELKMQDMITRVDPTPLLKFPDGSLNSSDL